MLYGMKEGAEVELEIFLPFFPKFCKNFVYNMRKAVFCLRKVERDGRECYTYHRNLDFAWEADGSE